MVVVSDANFRPVSCTQSCGWQIQAICTAVAEGVVHVMSQALSHGPSFLEQITARKRASGRSCSTLLCMWFAAVHHSRTQLKWQALPDEHTEKNLFPSCRVCKVMIGSIGEEASAIRDALPAGHGHIVMDTSLLPSVFRIPAPHSGFSAISVIGSEAIVCCTADVGLTRSIFEQAGMISDEL